MSSRVAFFLAFFLLLGGCTHGNPEEPLNKDIWSKRYSKYIYTYQWCRSKASVDRNALNGAITIEYYLDPNGKISDSRIMEDTTNQPVVGQCIVEQMKEWNLPVSNERTRFVKVLTYSNGKIDINYLTHTVRWAR